MSDHDFFDIAATDADAAYALLSGLITPRPIAWVTTVDSRERVNAAPFSFFNLIGAEPPVVVLGIGDRADGTPKDTALNIAATGEFVVNLVDEAVAAAMNITAAALPHGENEMHRAGLTAAPSRHVKPPRIAESPASLECRHVKTITIGENRILFGQIVAAHTRKGVVDPESLAVHAEAFRPVGRMGGAGYCRTADRFTMKRP